MHARPDRGQHSTLNPCPGTTTIPTPTKTPADLPVNTCRPTKPLHTWPDGSGTIAGRDLDGGGTWLGVNARGRLAFLTNLRARDPVEPSAHRPSHHASLYRPHASRGELPTSFLNGDMEPEEFVKVRQPAQTSVCSMLVIAGVE